MPEGGDALRSLVAALSRPAAYPHAVTVVEVVETHISVVFLAGEWAYKVKKPVDLGFLDFSTLERRRHFCEEELRLNRRLAPSLYRDVVPVVRTPRGLRLGGPGEAIEYAVRMRRFEQASQLDECLAAGQLEPTDLDEIAVHIARFHEAAAVAGPDDPWGKPAAVSKPIAENFATLEPALADTPQAATLAALGAWRAERFATLTPRFEARRAAGRVREGHGDLHLRNMARIDGAIVAFDGIEFDPALRWIDVVSDSAFLVMDLASRGRADLGWRFLNGWLSETGDYAGLELLDFYLVYRHLVRAKVDAIRLGQPGVAPAQRRELHARIGAHLTQARGLCDSRPAALLFTCGRSGSGKSRLARRLGAALPAVVLRSDVERKRLHGLRRDESGSGPPGAGIYTPSATRRTYRQLATLARDVLGFGYSVIVDAACLDPEHRRDFRALADDLGVPALTISVVAPRAVLEQRVAARAAGRTGASDAGPAVLAAQLEREHALDPDEQAAAITVDTSLPLDLPRLTGIIRDRIQGRPERDE